MELLDNLAPEESVMPRALRHFPEQGYTSISALYCDKTLLGYSLVLCEPTHLSGKLTGQQETGGKHVAGVRGSC